MDDPRVALQAALKEAMQQKDAMRRDVLRLSLNAIKQVEVDDEAMTILQKEAKKRRESIEEARSAGRDDIADDEATQLVVLEQFLPRQLGRDEVTALAREAITEAGAAGPQGTGKVMSVLMPKVRRLADGKLVNEVVRGLLN